MTSMFTVASSDVTSVLRHTADEVSARYRVDNSILPLIQNYSRQYLDGTYRAIINSSMCHYNRHQCEKIGNFSRNIIWRHLESTLLCHRHLVKKFSRLLCIF